MCPLRHIPGQCFSVGCAINMRSSLPAALGFRALRTTLLGVASGFLTPCGLAAMTVDGPAVSYVKMRSHYDIPAPAYVSQTPMRPSRVSMRVIQSLMQLPAKTARESSHLRSAATGSVPKDASHMQIGPHLTTWWCAANLLGENTCQSLKSFDESGSRTY